MADNASENVKAFNDLKEFTDDLEETFDDEDWSDLEEEDGQQPEEEESSMDNLEDILAPSEEATQCIVNGNDARDAVVAALNEWGAAQFTRLGCTAHGGQLELKSCVAKNSVGKKIQQYLNRVVTFFHKSPKWTERLERKTKLAILRPGDTRWNSIVFSLERLLQVFKIKQASLFINEYLYFLFFRTGRVFRQNEFSSNSSCQKKGPGFDQVQATHSVVCEYERRNDGTPCPRKTFCGIHQCSTSRRGNLVFGNTWISRTL